MNLGYCSRGLLGWWWCLEPLPSCPCKIQSVQMGGGWYRRYFWQSPTSMPCLVSLEWRGSHSQRTPIRCHWPPRKPWRGRERTLLLPWFDADTFIHEISIQVSSTPISLRRSGHGKSSQESWSRRVWNSRQRRVRWRSLLGRICRGWIDYFPIHTKTTNPSR